MNTRNLFAGTVALLALVSLSARSAEPMTQFTARSGSKVKIDGTANMIHTTWRVASPIIAGKLEVGPGFPVEPGQTATAGKINANADVFVSVSSLKSVEEDGTHYSDAMDNVMYEKLKAAEYSKIYWHLTGLTLKEAAKDKDAPYLFEATGDLALVGVTNAITMPISVMPLGVNSKGDRMLKISGSVSVKMTSFKMTPPTALAGALKTGDDVKLSFEWMVGHKPTSTAAAK
jgi:polyisoprenoid-binding protein YceI